MFLLEISSAKQKVFLKTDSKMVFRYFLDRRNVYPHTQIPGLVIKKISKIAGKNTAFLVEYKEAKKFSIIFKPERRQLLIRGNPEEIPTTQFVWFLLPIFEFLYEEEGMFGVHSACVSKGDKAILVLGDTLSGKSTISALLFSQYGFDFVCDEKCVINPFSGEIFSGNRVLGLRRDPFSQRITFRIEKYRIQRSFKDFFDLPRNSGKVRVISLIIPHFRELKLTIEKMNTFDSIIYLYDNITRTIRATNVVPVNGGSAFPSFDNKILANKRLEFVKEFIFKNKFSISFYMGRRKDICEAITKSIL